MPHCDLETGAVIFYERFDGIDGAKDRYFVVMSNDSPFVLCFTTTTQPHCETRPRLATEFCTIEKGETCLPKKCFVDFRTLHDFDDIELGSRLRSKSVKKIGLLPTEILTRIRNGVHGCRSLTPAQKRQVLAALNAKLGEFAAS